MGEHVAFLTMQDDLDPVVMNKLCTTFDKVYNFYTDATGTTPKPLKLHDGRLCIAEVQNTCGAGCGHIGATGIELMPQYFQVLYDGVKKRDEYDQVLPYEFGRNFWFYSKQLGYRDGDKDHAIVTGYAVFMRFASLDAAGVSLGPFRDRSGVDFRNQVVGLVDLYESDTSLTWENTIKVDQAPKNPMGLNGTDLFAGFCFRLAKQHGGADFIKRLWKEVAKRPGATTTQQAVDNFVLAASKAAGQDLTDLFTTTWRWPVSDAARQEARGNPVAIAAFPEEPKGPTSLTPEEAEKLICTDTMCRTVEKTTTYTVQIPYTEQMTRPDGVKVVTTKYRTEERTRTYTVTICGGDELSLNSLTDLTADTAKVLAKHKGSLNLDGLKELSPEIAKTLAACSAKLSLRGLTQLTPETATLLAARTANTDLSGLRQLKPDVAASLSAYSSGWLILNGLGKLPSDVAKPLAACSANLGLKGLTTLTPETARILANRTGNTDLGGLSELSPEVAQSLATFSSEGVCLNGLKTLTPDIAQALAKCLSNLSLGGVADLSPESAKNLSGYRGRGLYLDGLKTIPLEGAKSLAMTSGTLSLGGLETVSAEVAEVLCDRPAKVLLNGLRRVDRYAFELLNRKRALPSSVTVDNANSRVVVWKRMGEAPLEELLKTLSDEVGVPVTIDEQLRQKPGVAYQQATASPPRRVMDSSQAVAWIAKELGKELKEALVPVVTDTEVRFQSTGATKQEASRSAPDTASPAKIPDPPAAASAAAAPPSEPPATKEQVIDQKALRKAFGASRSSYDKKTGILSLAYDFSRPEQLKDWEVDNVQPAKPKGGKGIRVGPAESLVHRAVFQEGRCSFTYRLGDVTDKGAVISAGKVATVNQREWNRRRFFVLNGRDGFHPDDKHATVENASILQFNAVVGIEEKRCVLTVDGAETAVPRQNKGTYQIMLNGGDNGGDFAAVTILGKPDMEWFMNALGQEEAE
jgi:hypothetical protein